MTELTPAEKGAITKRINKERAIVEELELGEGEILVRNDDTGEIAKCVNSDEELEAQAAEGFKPWTPEWMEAEGDQDEQDNAGGDDGDGDGELLVDERGRVVFTVTTPNNRFSGDRHGVKIRRGVGTTTHWHAAKLCRDSGLTVTPCPIENAPECHQGSEIAKPKAGAE